MARHSVPPKGGAPSIASINCAVIRMRLPLLRTLPSSTYRHTKLLRCLADIDRATFVNKTGIAGNDSQSRQLRQRGDDVLDQTVAEIVLLGIATHVLKRSTAMMACPAMRKPPAQLRAQPLLPLALA